MLLAVFSDSHGNVEALRRAVRAAAPDAVAHLGDCVRDARALQADFPDLDLRCVRGNCDGSAKAEDRLLLSWEGVTIFATHGHLYSVKLTLDSLRNAAGFSGAALALFGHTHCPLYEELGGVQFLNPGAAEQGSYALVTLEHGTAACQIRKLPGGAW